MTATRTELTLTLAGDVSDEPDLLALSASLATHFGVPERAIVILVVGASIQLLVSILTASEADTGRVHAAVRSMAEDVAAASLAIGVSIQAVSPPTISATPLSARDAAIIDPARQRGKLSNLALEISLFFGGLISAFTLYRTCKYVRKRLRPTHKPGKTQPKGAAGAQPKDTRKRNPYAGEELDAAPPMARMQEVLAEAPLSPKGARTHGGNAEALGRARQARNNGRGLPPASRLPAPGARSCAIHDDFQGTQLALPSPTASATGSSSESSPRSGPSPRDAFRQKSQELSRSPGGTVRENPLRRRPWVPLPHGTPTYHVSPPAPLSLWWNRACRRSVPMESQSSRCRRALSLSALGGLHLPGSSHRLIRLPHVSDGGRSPAWWHHRRVA